jgi:hypothetical protein
LGILFAGVFAATRAIWIAKWQQYRNDPPIVPGQRWHWRVEGNPFQTGWTADIVAVKDGWVQYRAHGSLSSMCGSSFRYCYQREPEP